MRPLRIVVLGYIVRGPLGGLVWHHLQYVIGLKQLGHDVMFVEDSEDHPACYDPSRHVVDDDPTYGLAFLQQTFELVGLDVPWAYYDAHRARWLGPSADDAVAWCRTADVAINLSGVNPARPWLDTIPVRAFVDTDPVFTQIRSLTDSDYRALIDWHTVHFTFGERISGGASEVPDDGIAWQPTRQPVVLDCWKPNVGPPGGAYTTVMQWQSYQAREFDGRRFGMKSESFDAIESLPAHTAVPLAVALGGEAAPVERLRDLGWGVLDPLSVTRTAESYRQFLRDSRAEFSVAKHGYVEGVSGWFSERSAVYLASGRPVVTQDTGFSGILECGHGLFAYDSIETAIYSIEQIESDYADHCAAARRVAEASFDAAMVLRDLVSRLGER